jgi:hypothetical protein
MKTPMAVGLGLKDRAIVKPGCLDEGEQKVSSGARKEVVETILKC